MPQHFSGPGAGMDAVFRGEHAVDIDPQDTRAGCLRVGEGRRVLDLVVIEEDQVGAEAFFDQAAVSPMRAAGMDVILRIASSSGNRPRSRE